MEEKQLKIFKEKLDEIAKEHGFLGNHEINIMSTSSGGANYTSALYFVTISDPSKRDIELFAKVSNMNEDLLQMFQDDEKNLFKFEFDLYTLMNTGYKNIETKYNVPYKKRINIPKIYKGYFEKGQEFLIFENLLKKGYVDCDRMKSVTWEYAAKAVEQLANLHALSVAYQILEPEEAQNTLKFLPALKEKKKVDAVFQHQFENTTFPISEEKKNRLDRFKESGGLFNKDLYNFEPKMPVVLHCDYRSSNLMHRIKDGELEILMLDFQTMALGPPVFDLIYFIFLCTDGQFRKYHYDDLLNFYYNELKEALERFGLNPKEVYSNEDFKQEYKTFLHTGLIMSLFVLGLVLVEKEDAPNLGTDGVDVVFNMKKSDVYKQRLNEVLDDFIEWGII